MNLVTGASGLVGKQLVRLLVLKNESIRILIRDESQIKHFKTISGNIEIIIGDILDINSLDVALKGVKKVYHCAAIVSYVNSRNDEMTKVNVEGTANIVNLCLENKVDKLCHISSIASLRNAKENEPTSEKNHINESQKHSHYAFSKYYAELEVWRGIEEGLNAVILNPTIILGPGDWEKSSTKLFKYVWDENKYFINGGYNFIDVRDVVELAYVITSSEIKNEQFIVSGENWTYKDIFTEISKGLKKKAPSIQAGKTLKILVYIWSSLKSFFTGSEPIITKDALNKSDKNPSIDNSKIEKHFPHQYRKIDKTIAWTCKELLSS